MKDLDSPKKAFEQAKNYLNDNKLSLAKAQLLEILKVFPNELNSIFLLIDVLIKLNQPKDAIDYIHKGLEINPNSGELIEKEIQILLFQEKKHEACSKFEDLLKLRPEIGLLRQFTNILVELDREDDADEAIQNFLEDNKTYSNLYKGIRHAKAGRLKLAEETYKTILQDEPDNVDAMRLLGILATKGGKYKIAEQILIKAIQIAPTYSLLWRNISLVYRLSGQLEKAQKSMDNILALDPKNASVWADYGTILIMLAKYKEAIVAYSRCVSLKADSPRAYLSLGHAYNTIGNKDKSIESYINAIKHNPDSGEAYWSLANLKTYTFTNKQINEMEDTVKSDISEIEKIQLLFALGKAYEGSEQYELSFKKYQEGNWLKRKSIKYSSQNNTENINKTIEFFNKKNIQKIKKSKCLNNDPIFILGLPRSGSTLIDQIISSHSMVDGTQELPNIMNLSKEVEALGKDSKAYPNFLSKLSELQISDLGKKYIDQTKWGRGNAPFFIDKMPNNFLHIGLIKTILPNAKIIDTRRGAMDTCFSCFKQFFAKGQLFTYDLEDLGLFYNDYIKLMNHWHDLYPNEIYTVKYSNMINNTDAEIANLLDYCNLPFESQCLEFYKSKRPVKTPSADQVRQPIYKSGLDYWKNFENDLSPLQKLFNDEILND